MYSTAIAKLNARTKSYVKASDGNISMMLAIAIVPLIIAVGAAIDYTQVTSDIRKAQSASDSAVLAAAAAYYENFSKSESRQTGRLSASINADEDFVPDDGTTKTKIIKQSDGSLLIETTITGKTENAFMGIVGKPVTEWKTVSYSEVSPPPSVEIFLVLDVSQSMLENNKIDRLKSAVDQFIVSAEPYNKSKNAHTTISLIPFSENVNLGPNSDNWLTPNNPLEFSDNFYGCFRHNDSTTTKPGDFQATQQGQSSIGATLCPPEESKAILFSTDEDLLRSHVKSMEVGYGTNTTWGLEWTHRFLTSYWRNLASFSTEPPKPIDIDTKKFVILLTDGEISVTDSNQNGIIDREESHTDNSGINRIEDFKDRCNLIGNIPNLDLYSIGFDVNDGDLADALKGCIKGEGQYFDAGLNDLSSIFQDISADLKPIRITQ